MAMAFKQYISFLIILKIVKKTFNTDFKQVNFKCCEYWLVNEKLFWNFLYTYIVLNKFFCSDQAKELELKHANKLAL